MKQDSPRRMLLTSILLVLVAIVSITAATTAWLSLGDNTRVYSMYMDVTSGANIRFDLDPHPTIDEYTKTLNFTAIAQRIRQEKGFDPQQTPLMPVTTADYVRFTDEPGNLVPANSGDYLEFTLHFMASRDVIVHLTSSNSPGNNDGTRISSDVQTLPSAMRISFTDGNNTVVYDPGMGDTQQIIGNVRHFGLPGADSMVYSDSNVLFPLTEGVNKPIVVRIWMEGTDEACTDALQKAAYTIALRFEATDENNIVFDRSTHG